jgi:hypothetical protein
MKTYKSVNGTSYDTRTPEDVVRVMESARKNRTRIHISLGDTVTGRDWLEEFETHGYVGRSTGPIKVPLLVANRRSMGGGEILTHCIVRIRESAGGRMIYRHPAYDHGNIAIRRKGEAVTLPDGRVLAVDVLRDGEVHAAFENVAQARRWLRKMGVVSPMFA